MRLSWSEVRRGEVAPSRRCSHAALAVDGGLLILGGGAPPLAPSVDARRGTAPRFEHAFEHTGDAWLFSSADATWREVAIDDLVPRRGHSAVLDGARSEILVFGGVTDGRQAAGEDDATAAYVAGDRALRVYAWDGAALAGRPSATSGCPPLPRRAHVAFRVDAADAMVVYGGYVADAAAVALGSRIAAASTPYVLDLATRAWSAVGLPGGGRDIDALLRSGESAGVMERAFRGVALAAAAATKTGAVLVGGVSATIGVAGGVHGLRVERGENGAWADTWSTMVTGGDASTFADSAWTPRYGAAAATVGGRLVVVFGGCVADNGEEGGGAGRDLADTFCFDASATEDPPRPPDAFGRVEERLRPAFLADGPSASGVDAPPARNSASLTTIETVSGETVCVLFGGGVFGGEYFADTRVLRVAGAPERAPRRRTATPRPLAELCEAALAPHLDGDNVLALLGVARDRGCETLRRACLGWIQERFNPIFRPRGAGASSLDDDALSLRNAAAKLPGYEAAVSEPALARDLRRAISGL